ncbi:MAG TPA: DUF2971 domain-containing protein [Pirellulaceae bacterium]|nr:DUF2971 domain-containing protein [Pirellulaceae bacterium]HMO93853.1 DUF2971 domain-containing protein [Pirellulaceae bacterium]
MKLYRYRPITNFLFKELLYQEIYLASFSELNDPLDMTTHVNFHTAEIADARNLARFVCGRILRDQIRLALKEDKLGVDRRNRDSVVEVLNDAARLDELAAEILRHMTDCDSQGTIDVDGLFGVLSTINSCRSSEFPFLGQLSTVRDDIDATIAVFLNNSYVACFAEKADNFLMWSHYADRHQGICLEFETPRQSDTECQFPVEMCGRPKEDNDKTPHRLNVELWRFDQTARRVNYVRTIEPLRFYDFLPVFANEGDIDLHELSKSRWHPFADLLRSTFLQKQKRWKSEKEWRIIEVNFKKGNLPEDRIYRYNINALTGIVFGYRTAAQVRRRTCRIVRAKSNDVIFYQAKMNNDATLSIVESDENDVENVE